MGANGKWYAAIRVPPTSDARTLKRLKESQESEIRIRHLESEALQALQKYDRSELSLQKCLNAILRYDSLLSREDLDTNLAQAYRNTLIEKPWKECSCQMCRTIGINVIIFRGLNRNKRRGAHNTLQLYKLLQ